MEAVASALLEVGLALRCEGYHFTTVTPRTHARVLRRAARVGTQLARGLRDVFGWNLPFRPELLGTALLRSLQRADALTSEGDLLRSRVRFASHGEQLFVHSAFPTLAADAVFFGPDTYRFCALLQRWMHRAECVIDIGCGSGAGGLSVAGRVRRVVLSDVNAQALGFSEINAELNQVSARVQQSDVLAGIDEGFDCVIANPPYMLDAGGRVYRNGGGAYGEALSVRIVREALARLGTDGTLIVYTGSAIVAGEDTFFRAVAPELERVPTRHTYVELDPDVFDDELDQPGYESVDRIAAVALHVRKL